MFSIKNYKNDWNDKNNYSEKETTIYGKGSF